MTANPPSDGFQRLIRKAGMRPQPPADFDSRLRRTLDQGTPEVEAFLRGQEIAAYLDGELDEDRRRAFEARAKADPGLQREIEEERRLLGFVKKIGLRVDVPESLAEGIRRKLNQADLEVGASEVRERRTAPPPPERASESLHASRRRPQWVFLVAAASVAIVLLGMWLFRNPDCPYMIACSEEHKMVVSGEAKISVSSADRLVLAGYVAERTHDALTAVPDLEDMAYVPIGAGNAAFKGLNAPPGVFVEYRRSDGDALTFLVHEWPEGEPDPATRRTRDGMTYWVAEHGGCQLVCWKQGDGKVLCAVVCSNHELEKVFQMAAMIRDALDE